MSFFSNSGNTYFQSNYEYFRMNDGVNRTEFLSEINEVNFYNFDYFLERLYPNLDTENSTNFINNYYEYENALSSGVNTISNIINSERSVNCASVGFLEEERAKHI